MSLRTRLLGIATLIVLVASTACWALFQRLAEQVIDQWGAHLVETQVRYDRARLLQALEREIALTRQMADSLNLRRWAAAPDDPARRALAFEELESYRQNFRDKSYFVALLASGAYYHNNAENAYAGRELRYHLSPERPEDAWFYQLVRTGKDFHLNVNPDAELGVTKVWIDMLLRDGEQVLGVLGTGLDLDAFLGQIVDLRQRGVTTLFVDGSGAIQLHRDVSLIDYATLIKPEGQKSTLEAIFQRPEDRAEIQRLLTSLSAPGSQDEQVLKTFVEVEGKRYLAGLSYMPTLGWYEISLLDLDELMPLASFLPLMTVFLVILVLTLLLSYAAVRHLLLTPLEALERAMLRVRDGHLEQLPVPPGRGEMARVIQHFVAMADAIRDNTRHLESKVLQRTEALERLTRVDPLTDLLNRRGMTERLEQELDRARREGWPLAILWLDVDHFKAINDELGHACGDQALQRIAGILRGCLRRYDQASRWGGDEFLVLLTHCDAALMLQIAERIRATVEDDEGIEGRRLAVSVGAHLATPGEALDAVLQHADEALYAAKSAGRNRVCRAVPSPQAPDPRSHTSQS